MSVEAEVLKPARVSRPHLMLIDRYITGLTIRPFALALSVVLAALLLERLLRLFDLLALKGGPFGVVIGLAANLVPYYLGLALPAAFFFAVFFAVARMGDDSELDVLIAGGLSITRLSRPFFAIGFLLAIISLPLFGFLQPYSRYAYRAILYDAINAGWDARAQPATFVDAPQGLALSADTVDISGRVLTHLFLRKITPEGEQVTTAAKGVLVLSDDGKQLNLYAENGTTFEDRGNGQPLVVHFENLKLNVQFASDAPPFRARGDNERELTFFEILSEIDNPVSGVPPRRLASEFNARIVRALSLPVLPLVAVPFAMAAKRQRRTSAMIMAGLLLLAYHHALQLGESLADTGRLPALPALWVPFGLFTIFCVWLFRNSRERPGDNPISHAVERMQDLLDAIRRSLNRLRGKAAT